MPLKNLKFLNTKKFGISTVIGGDDLKGPVVASPFCKMGHLNF